MTLAAMAEEQPEDADWLVPGGILALVQCRNVVKVAIAMLTGDIVLPDES